LIIVGLDHGGGGGGRAWTAADIGELLVIAVGGRGPVVTAAACGNIAVDGGGGTPVSVASTCMLRRGRPSFDKVAHKSVSVLVSSNGQPCLQDDGDQSGQPCRSRRGWTTEKQR